MKKRYVMNPRQVPAGVTIRILDRGAIYPDDSYPLSFGTHYIGSMSESDPGKIEILDDTGSFRLYPAAWFSEIIATKEGFKEKPLV